MILKVARPLTLSRLFNRSFLQNRGLLQKTFNHDESDFTRNRCSTFQTTYRCFSVRHIFCDSTEKFRTPTPREYILGRLRALIFFIQHPSFKFRDALKGCEEAMSIVSDLITKKQFDKLQGMIDTEVLNHLESKLATTSWIHPILVDPVVKKFTWQSFKEIENTESGTSKLSLDTMLLTGWNEFRIIHYYQFQRYFVGGKDQDWIITNITILRVDF